ncbi:uncharacterized protein A4U43_UnF8840 [Asparagus officinalis]|uniref:Uncharacterized protein n=1 Tax=Asparagus officinalis TaxID=4686 RepID=A0A1R3L5V4_ASPOF|nr:uncharacterized protein A4U43_UnF8840 [Asparagus officinalis]
MLSRAPLWLKNQLSGINPGVYSYPRKMKRLANLDALVNPSSPVAIPAEYRRQMPVLSDAKSRWNRASGRAIPRTLLSEPRAGDAEPSAGTLLRGDSGRVRGESITFHGAAICPYNQTD